MKIIRCLPRILMKNSADFLGGYFLPFRFRLVSSSRTKTKWPLNKWERNFYFADFSTCLYTFCWRTQIHTLEWVTIFSDMKDQCHQSSGCLLKFLSKCQLSTLHLAVAEIGFLIEFWVPVAMAVNQHLVQATWPAFLVNHTALYFWVIF